MTKLDVMKGFPGLLVGWKPICQHIGVKSVNTAKKLAKKYAMPVRLYPTRRPCALIYELNEWFILYDEICEKAGLKERIRKLKAAKGLKPQRRKS